MQTIPLRDDEEDTSCKRPRLDAKSALEIERGDLDDKHEKTVQDLDRRKEAKEVPHSTTEAAT
jgi:hypothetical protein